MLAQLLCIIAFTYGIIAPAWSADYFVTGSGGDNKNNTYKKRKYHRTGFTVQFFGDPFPSINSINLNINTSKLTRFHVGGGISRSTTVTSKVYGAGLDFTFNKWVFSPIIGIGYAAVKNNPNGMQVDSSFPGLNFKQDVGGTGAESYSHLYWSAGAELRLYQKSLILGIGYKASQKKDVGGWGYLSIGLFFQ